MKVTEKDREAALAITGPCSCDVAYTGRGLRSPDCHYCNDAEDIAEAIAAAYARGLEDAAKVLPKLPRYEIGGECDGDSGHCYAEMELDDTGRYVGIDDAQDAIRKLGEGE